MKGCVLCRNQGLSQVLCELVATSSSACSVCQENLNNTYCMIKTIPGMGLININPKVSFSLQFIGIPKSRNYEGEKLIKEKKVQCSMTILLEAQRMQASLAMLTADSKRYPLLYPLLRMGGSA